VDPDAAANTAEILANNLDVTFGTPVVSGTSDFPDTKVPVTLKNKGTTEATFMLTVVAVKNGQEVESDLVFSEPIPAGGTANEDAFTFVLNADNLNGATFKVKEATMITF
jgi:hypothetical protein